MVIEARTEGRARAVETVPAEFSGDEPGIAFNPHYLLDGLTAAASPAVSPAARDSAAGDPDPRGQHGAAEEGGSAAGGKPPEPGLVRIEFTSPAKPALITRAAAAEGGAGPEPGTAPVPEFRYLVVPLRAVARS